MSDPMTNESGREALRGAEVHTLDLIFEAFTSEQWAELLRAPLERAAAKGRKYLAQRLVRAGANIGGALHKAIEGGHGDIVNHVLENGASLSAKDTNGYAPLHVATAYGEREIVQLLLLKGADKDAFDNKERTPLFLAAYCGTLDATLALLAGGVDVSLRCGQRNTPAIQAAARNGHAEILRAVIEHGADVDAVDIDRDTALHVAARHNEADAIDVLIGAGADIEARNAATYTPLHCACFNFNREALLRLSKHGATVNAQNNALETPLVMAAAFAGTLGAAEMVDSLLRAGADETIVAHDGKKAADAIGERTEEEDRLVEDFERVRELLANAPADRAWRRRGYLVLCRTHPDRVQPSQVINGTHRTNVARRTRSRTPLARAEGTTENSTVDDTYDGDWDVVVAKVFLLQEEGIFRTIVDFL